MPTIRFIAYNFDDDLLCQIEDIWEIDTATHDQDRMRKKFLEEHGTRTCVEEEMYKDEYGDLQSRGEELIAGGILYRQTIPGVDIKEEIFTTAHSAIDAAAADFVLAALETQAPADREEAIALARSFRTAELKLNREHRAELNVEGEGRLFEIVKA